MPRKSPCEFALVALRECAVPLLAFDEPTACARYWREHIATERRFNRAVEWLAVLLLDCRLNIKGHVIVGQGIANSVLMHPREVFRPAILSAANSVVVMHNHPSGSPDPSGSDIRMTRNLREAGKIIGIELLDHIIMGRKCHSSLRALGYFAEPKRRKRK